MEIGELVSITSIDLGFNHLEALPHLPATTVVLQQICIIQSSNIQLSRRILRRPSRTSEHALWDGSLFL